MRRQSRMPTDDVLLAERAQGRSVEKMAYDWEVKPATIRAALRRIDAARAVALAQREGITRAEAVAFIRADIDQASSRVQPFVPDGPPAGFPVPRMSPALTGWFDALVAGHALPDLQLEDIHNV